MILRRAAAAMGALAIALPAPAWAGGRSLKTELCSGRTVPVPLNDDAPDPPGSVGCHAVACLGGRTKSNGERK